MGCKIKANRHGYLAYQLFWKGLRTWEGTDRRDTPENRRVMEARAVVIGEEMRRGAFDYLRWFPNGNRAGLFRPRPREGGTIRQFYEQWIRSKIPPLVRKSLERHYRYDFGNHILPRYGSLLLREFSVRQLREFRAYLVDGAKLSLKTSKNVIAGTLKAFFRDAKAEGEIDKSPFEDLPASWWPRVPTQDPDPFDEGERDRILAYFWRRYGHRWPQGYAFVSLLFWTGARPSELTALRWRDVNLETGMIFISRSRSYGEEGATKTRASTRAVRLLAPALDALKAVRPAQPRPGDHVLLDQRGKPINQWKFGELHFQGALAALKIRHRDFYSTRHSFISVMLSHGENPKEIADYTGTSLLMISTRYGKFIRPKDRPTFGTSAIRDAQEPQALSETLGETLEAPKRQARVRTRKTVVRGGGFEPSLAFASLRVKTLVSPPISKRKGKLSGLSETGPKCARVGGKRPKK